MRVVLLLVVLCCVSGVVYAQGGNVNLGGTQLEVRLKKGDGAVDGAKGSPYLSKEFVPAQVDDFTKPYLVRYNAHDGVMEFKNEQFVTLVMSNQEDHVIRMKDGTGYVYKTVDLMGKRELVRVAWSDDKGHAFLVKPVVKFFAEQVATSSYDLDKPARYEREADAFYYKSESGLVIDLPKKKNKLVKLFSDKGAKLFFKREKVDLKSEAGMSRFIEACLAQ